MLLTIVWKRNLLTNTEEEVNSFELQPTFIYQASALINSIGEDLPKKNRISFAPSDRKQIPTYYFLMIQTSIKAHAS